MVIEKLIIEKEELQEEKQESRMIAKFIIVIFVLLVSILCLLKNTFPHFTSINLDRNIVYWRGHVEQERKITRVAFLKVPKAGSSTIACIFCRFGVNNNLTLFLPKQTFIGSFEQKLLLQRKMHYDMFVIHTHYDNYFFTHIVHDPAIIGIVRKPEDRIVSHVFYFKLYKKFKRLKGLAEQDFINKVVSNTSKYGIQNYMSTFFGINNMNISKHELQTTLMRLKAEFLLVVVLEKINESLVLLKRLLNWSIFDILYAAKKTSHHGNIYLNTSQRKSLKLTNRIEYEIYDFFNNELEMKMINEGGGFRQEVLYFEHVLTQVNIFCKATSKYTRPYTFSASRWNERFSISLKDCITIFKNDVAQFKRKRVTIF